MDYSDSEITESDQDQFQIPDQQIQNPARQKILQKYKLKRKVFAISLIISVIIIAINQGLFTNTTSFYINPNLTISFIQILKPLIISIASVLGLGLIFSYNKQLVFTGLGSVLFINAFSILYYPLINNLFTSVNFFVKDSTQVQNTSKLLYLSDSVISPLMDKQNTIENCFKSAMALSVAFSSILGRVTLFQVWLIVIMGTFGFQLNRRLSLNSFGDDILGSLYIFTFGGFMGLAISCILRRKQVNVRSTRKNKLYDSSPFTATLALIGSILLMITLPFFPMNYYQDTLINNLFLNYTPSLNLILSSSQGLMGSIIVSLFIRRQILYRDFIHGPLSGIIFSGVSSYFTVNLAFSLTAGLMGGAIQSAVQNKIQRNFCFKRRAISTISFTLFGVQGLLSSFVSCIAKFIIQTNSQGLGYTRLSYQTYKLFLNGIVSAAIGCGFGVIIGIICYFIHTHYKQIYFNDFHEWKFGTKLVKQKQPPQTKEPPMPSLPSQSIQKYADEFDILQR